ncbi:MAG: TetR/AcrR family transcriptional regulator, partial [Actinomycetota bacterium]|nr:TetR/AcrR family transcriptional regulator [Actinomycetota bacterium]
EDEQRRPPLTRPRVVRTALRLVDERGLAALTMRALASELEVSPMALYNHVRDKDELVDLMVDLMLGEVDCSATPGDWAAQLRALVCSYHQVLSAHRGLARIYSVGVRLGPHGLLIMERALGLLLGAGFSPPAAANAFFALYTYTVGFHQMGRITALNATPGHGTDDQLPESIAMYCSALPPEQIPSVGAVGAHLGGVRRKGGFEYGLDLLLTGLRVKLAEGHGGVI